MPTDIRPPELAQLLEFSERPRTDDWSLRAALVRYAQPEPQRVNDLLELVRRTEWALGKQNKLFEREGERLWSALEGGGPTGDDAQVVGLLRVARELDQLGDVLATWAVDITGTPPDDVVDNVLDDVEQQLDALGVPREEQAPRPRGRG